MNDGMFEIRYKNWGIKIILEKEIKLVFSEAVEAVAVAHHLAQQQVL